MKTERDLGIKYLLKALINKRRKRREACCNESSPQGKPGQRKDIHCKLSQTLVL